MPEMTETKNFLCVSCPVGCSLKVEVLGTEVRGKDVISVEGNACPRGVKYAQSEVTNPTRTFTTTVRVKGAALPVCPVRSKTPLPLEKVFDVTREVAKVSLNAPVVIGQILIENVCGTGADIVACRSLPCRSLPISGGV